MAKKKRPNFFFNKAKKKMLSKFKASNHKKISNLKGLNFIRPHTQIKAKKKKKKNDKSHQPHSHR
jgi:hypothetical protein